MEKMKLRIKGKFTNNNSTLVTISRLKKNKVNQYNFITSFSTFDEYLKFIDELRIDLFVIKNFLKKHRLIREVCLDYDITRVSLYRFIEDRPRIKQIVEYPLIMKLISLRDKYKPQAKKDLYV